MIVRCMIQMVIFMICLFDEYSPVQRTRNDPSGGEIIFCLSVRVYLRPCVVIVYAAGIII
jgi:hypothetical protein